ncbi:MAG: hypothetical protein REI78_03680 [Pedobacter sp.]|nr:hypothetical protein [Pedobacter sp.]MDQ8052096.1 hypothetical protein [Pedobacter sp.]
MGRYIFMCLIFWCNIVDAQVLKLRARHADALVGKAFALSISDSTLTLEKREEIIFKEIKNGNVPNFLRKLKKISDTLLNEHGNHEIISYYVVPDYLAIGDDTDFFYVPMTPILAQRVANLVHCSLPTAKMVDAIYRNATIKLSPQPIPPTKAMTTVPAFIAHTDSVMRQLQPYIAQHLNGELTAGNKKDVILSPKIYTEKTPKVVIYGWHKPDGKPIQPIYNKHTNLWADYSHGIRLIQQSLTISSEGRRKKSTIAKVLSTQADLLSSEGQIDRPYYPILSYP